MESEVEATSSREEGSDSEFLAHKAILVNSPDAEWCCLARPRTRLPKLLELVTRGALSDQRATDASG
jgi:hypothetical protein